MAAAVNLEPPPPPGQTSISASALPTQVQRFGYGLIYKASMRRTKPAICWHSHITPGHAPAPPCPRAQPRRRAAKCSWRSGSTRARLAAVAATQAFSVSCKCKSSSRVSTWCRGGHMCATTQSCNCPLATTQAAATHLVQVAGQFVIAHAGDAAIGPLQEWLKLNVIGSQRLQQHFAQTTATALRPAVSNTVAKRAVPRPLASAGSCDAQAQPERRLLEGGAKARRVFFAPPTNLRR